MTVEGYMSSSLRKAHIRVYCAWKENGMCCSGQFKENALVLVKKVGEMDMEAFNKLSLTERNFYAIDNGKHLRTLGEKDKCFSVYSLTDFYVVVHYDADTYDIKWVKTLRSDKPFEVFLKELNLLTSKEHDCGIFILLCAVLKKKVKKKKSKYDIKFRVDASFEDIIKKAVAGNPKPKSKK